MPTALTLIDASRHRLEQANLFYGHGTANAEDDAIFLVLHGLGLGYDASEEQLNADLSRERCSVVEDLIERRIRERIPSAYLTQRMWFAELEFYVDERALIPRSPLAELIMRGFSPWSDSQNLTRILEIGTGSGCIALALGHYFPDVTVTATDISAAALEVAALNLNRFEHLRPRVNFVQADLFPPESRRFDLIVTNPPYVPAEQMATLPAEYLAEPASALVAGADGLEFIDKIFRNASNLLSDNGLIFFDVGDRWALLEEVYPDLPFVWCELERGGEGIGMLDKQALNIFNQNEVK